MTKYKDVYGKYSLGSGAILSDENKVWDRIDEPEIMAAYNTSIRRDLVKSGISLDDLSHWYVMDIGTGRQALTFLDIGADKVDHFDISPENVARLSEYRANTAIEDRLTTTCCDVVKTDLGSDKYDFIYLNGIVQHFSNVGAGIENCIKALKKGGQLWLYFYRSGTFDNFVAYMVRDLIHSSNVAKDDKILKEHFIASILSYSDDATKNYATSMYIDGAFTRFAQLFTLSTYIDFIAVRGLKIVSSSGLDPLGKDVDHYFSRAATVITLQKTDDDIDFSALTNTLSPENDVNQLDKSLYNQPEILATIDLYTQLKSLLNTNNVPASLTTFVAVRLFDFLASKTRSADYNPMDRHTDMQSLMINIIKLIEGEYANT
ncbi:MAG: methyltransferase domain-containing protein [Rhodospirillales bacterium]|nr:methyltransferase domain-containing protein [Rhodospirillales bacterium]